MRVVQFKRNNELFVAKVLNETEVQVIQINGGLFEAAKQCIAEGIPLSVWIDNHLSTEICDYQTIVDEQALVLPVFHPNPNECLVAGTGLTHLGSADTRNAMHNSVSSSNENMSDSMKMFKLGLEGGKPGLSEIGSQPEWFYKGDGYTLVDPGSDLPVPAFALDAGEEPELVGIYLIGDDLKPYRIGFAVGNEFSDHVTEKGNYLWLAHSKLRYSSYGPELFIGELPAHLKGQSKIYRNGDIVWQKEFLTGEDNMSHSIANLEHHHFKYQQFCQPGQIHVHYFGTATLSFGDNFKTQDGDVFEISLPEFGRPLRNSIKTVSDIGLIEVASL